MFIIHCLIFSRIWYYSCRMRGGKIYYKILLPNRKMFTLKMLHSRDSHPQIFGCVIFFVLDTKGKRECDFLKHSILWARKNKTIKSMFELTLYSIGNELNWLSWFPVNELLGLSIKLANWINDMNKLCYNIF